jgi:hypothetical protein
MPTGYPALTSKQIPVIEIRGQVRYMTYKKNFSYVI